LHLTSRQDLQLHDLKLEQVPALLRKLAAVGLSTRGGGGNTVRNIMASVEAGSTPDEPFDVGPWLDALTNAVIREADSWTLPRKFKMAFSATDEDTALAGFNDLGFFPRLDAQGRPGFKVYAAGGLGGKPRTGLLFYDFIPAPELHLLVTAVKRFFDQHGNRKNKRQARLRFLREKFGDQGLLEQLRQAVDALRTQGFPLLEPAPRILNDPAPSPFPEAPKDKGFELWQRRYVSAGKRAGVFNVLAPVLLGDLGADLAERLGQALQGFGDAVLRLEQRQNLVLTGIPVALLGNVYNLLEPLELSRQPRLLGSTVACTGADTCKLGLCLPKGATRELGRRLSQAGLDLDSVEGFRLHISGCPNTCAQHMLADLGFYGLALRQGQRMYPAYAVVAGGQVGEGRARLAHEVARVSAKGLPAYVVAVLSDYLSRRRPGQAFSAWLQEDGEERLKALAPQFAQVADWSEDKNAYFDWGAEEPFSAAKGGAECSAGLFDLIDVDRKIIADQRGLLAQAPSAAERQEALYQVALSASRMLLVTRGLEPANDAAVLDLFQEWFIAKGLVDARFSALLRSARDGRGAGLAAQAIEVQALADAVEALYQGMDDSLRFPAEVKAAQPPQPQPAPEAAQSRDYRGVACPMNFVKVKLDLAKMAPGQVLKVLLDDGQPIQNVPGSVRLEGHEVAAVTRQPEGHWELTIRKR
jgi:sulfite reductase (ferredoxin)